MIDDTEIREQVNSLLRSNRAMTKMLQRIVAMILGTVIVIACLLIDSELSRNLGLALAAAIGIVVAYLFTRKEGTENE